MNLTTKRFTAPWIATAVVATVAIGGGTAAALGPSGTISACVAHGSGTLYTRSHCRAHDRALSWNAAGPQGAQGQRGQQGAPGTNGTNGLGPGYSAYAETPLHLSGDYVEHPVATLTLPPGAAGAYYAVSAKVVLSSNGPSTVAANYPIQCQLFAGANVDTSSATLPGAYDAETMALQVTGYRAAGDTVSLECYDPDHPVIASEARIAAIQLSSLNGASH